jgi:hypothetical protein
MKMLLTLLLLTVATVVAQPLPRDGVWITAREKTDVAKEFYRYGKDEFGGFIRTRWGSRELLVKLRRTLPGNATVGFETLFLTGFAPKYGIVEHRRRTLDLPESREIEVPLLCGYNGTQTHLNLIGQYDFEGTPKPTAWAIRVWSGGKVIAQAASLPEILTWLETAKLPEPGK